MFVTKLIKKNYSFDRMIAGTFWCTTIGTIVYGFYISNYKIIKPIDYDQNKISDYDILVDLCKKLDLDQETIYIKRPYPGFFYKKIYDDGRVKVFKRNGITKLYIYPTFKPNIPKNE